MWAFTAVLIITDIDIIIAVRALVQAVKKEREDEKIGKDSRLHLNDILCRFLINLTGHNIIILNLNYCFNGIEHHKLLLSTVFN